MHSIISIQIRVDQSIFRNYSKHCLISGIIVIISINHRINLSPTTFQTVFFSSDIDRSGTISIDEFIKVGNGFLSQEQLVTELQVSQIKYNSLNRDENGKVELSYDTFVNLVFSIRSQLVFVLQILFRINTIYYIKTTAIGIWDIHWSFTIEVRVYYTQSFIFFFFRTLVT